MNGDMTYDPLDDIEDEKLDAAREAAWRRRHIHAFVPRFSDGVTARLGCGLSVPDILLAGIEADWDPSEGRP